MFNGLKVKIMKKKVLFAAMALVAFASCSTDEMIGVTGPQDNSPSGESNAIVFASATQGVTRAGENIIGATAAEKLGGMFVVEGTKGEEQGSSTVPATDPSPSIKVVFDNYLVGYDYNSAGTTESNTRNWEYVGKEDGITERMSEDTWEALHPEGTAQVQSIKYWDYSVPQYDFIAWSTGTCEAIPFPATAAEPEAKKIQVSRINTGNTLATTGFRMKASSANDLLECYYTDINKVEKTNYGAPVTLTFRNMAAKVRVALYETVPGYSVKDVKFYSADDTSNPYKPTDLGSGTSTTATLFTTGSDRLPQSGEVIVYYPRIGTDNQSAKDYNKASVTVNPGTSVSSTQTFGTLISQYRTATGNEPTGVKFLGTSLPSATFAGDKTKDFYEAVIPNTNGKPLTLRVDYTLVSTDGNAEEIKVYGAKAVVPATYTVWQPNYAYTYIFKISDNSNGWTSQTNTDPQGLFPITFDAVVTNFVNFNDEQTTVTTVATPSITTYQQGHDHANKDEYSKSQTAGVSTAKKDVYVQVMDNSGATPTLKTDLNETDKSLLFAVSDPYASEAEVMDALQNRTNTPAGDPAAAYKSTDPIVGRNGITLTKDASHLSNTETSIVNGVDDQPITKIDGVAITAGKVAKIDIDQLETGTYAYVYSTPPTSEEKVYNVVSTTEANNHPTYYYEVSLTGSETPIASTAADDDKIAKAGWVYFVKNLKADDSFDSYTFKQTKVGENVVGLVGVEIPGSTASTYTAGRFYFDVYYKNNGKYAVKVIKVVN